MGKQRVLVTISDSKLIPTIGKGPINKPISITVPQYEMLKKFGFNISKVNEQLSKIEKIADNSVIEPEKKMEEVVPPVELPTEPEEPTTEEVPEQVEETPEEEVVEEEVTEESEESEDTVYTEEDLKEATKKELKEVLDARGVEYKYNDTVPTLKELVLSSNPEA
jgi:hypothetical protein